MLSLSNGGMSAGHAARYFSREDYYLKGGEPSRWIGKGSAQLGLSGEVREEDFRRVCQGEAPDGTRLVAHKITREDGDQVEHHRAGNDLTFSAPKSVSIGYAAGNRELKEIWDQAVENTMRHVEEHYSLYRTRAGVKASGNIVAAKFDHVTSRTLDPEVHSHVFLVNMTRVPGAEGRWKANEPRTIYSDKIRLGMLARQEAITLYRQAGYRIYFTNRAQLLFELEGVSPRELEVFSRRSAAIAERVAQWKEGHRFPGVSEGVLKQMAALDTRDPKRSVTREDVLREWDRGFAVAGTSARELCERIEAARHLKGKEPDPAPPDQAPPPFRYLAPGAYPRGLGVVLKHTQVVELKEHPDYQAAKRGGDLDGARRVVAAVVRPEIVEEIRSRLPARAEVYVIPVLNREGPRHNLLPLAYAEKLAGDLGGVVWDGVAKVGGGHNTGAGIDQRLHNRPEFDGPLPPVGSAIVLADDAFTVGGTLAGLVDHVAKGGNVPVCATVLASGRYGEDLAPRPEQIEALLEKCCVDPGQFLAEQGYPPQALTGSEIRCYLRNGGRGIDGARIRFYTAGDRTGDGESDDSDPAPRAPGAPKNARAVVRLAAKYLTEKEAVIDRAELLKTAVQISGGKHGIAELDRALDGWVGRTNGIERLGRESRGRQAGRELYSTGQMRELEAKNLGRLKTFGEFQSVTSRDEVEAYLDRMSRDEGVTLSAGQRRHIVNELAGGKGIAVTQGAPGTGKTYSAELVERFDREVLEPSGRRHRTINLAYTGKAALEMAKANGQPASTIDSFLNSFQRDPYLGPDKHEGSERARQVQVVVKVDEASLVGARQARHLLDAIDEMRGEGVPVKLVLIGDRKQLQSIQSGPFFDHASREVRGGRGDYAELCEIARQKDPSLRLVAEVLNRESGGELGANAQAALNILERQGRVTELWDRQELVGAAVTRYLQESGQPHPDPSRSAAGEHKNVLLVTPLNLDREELNLRVREALGNVGRLGAGKRLPVLSQVRQEVTVSSLQPGMILVFNGERGENGRMRPVPRTYLNQQGEIQSIDPERNTVTVRLFRNRACSPRAGNLTRTFDADRLSATSTAYRREEREFAPGDRVVFGKTIRNRCVTDCEPGTKGRGVRNGEMGEIVTLADDGTHSVARVRLDDGRSVNLNLDRYGPLPIDYGYAVTVYKGQGGTVDTVLPFHYVKPGIENDRRVLETLAGVRLEPPQFRQWNRTLSEQEKGYRAPVTIGGHRGELSFLMLREKETGLEHKGVAVSFFNGPAVAADEAVRHAMRDAGMYWIPERGVWFAAATNDRAVQLMDRHPLKDPGYTARLKLECVRGEPGVPSPERNYRAELDVQAMAERYGRVSFNAFNVAVTRARYDTMVFTNSIAGLKEAVLVVDEKTSTVDHPLKRRIDIAERQLAEGPLAPPGPDRHQLPEPEVQPPTRKVPDPELEH